MRSAIVGLQQPIDINFTALGGSTSPAGVCRQFGSSPLGDRRAFIEKIPSPIGDLGVACCDYSQ